ncbi:hypothetical protein M501DRAFT_1060383 [Patellaria atrata CBS 101060]|uniref:Uncharacterized protein n=1 Tax=Patellaria atrata CBS 101060 TaxID=1346257 RepID=A0A9P4VQ45_9PEZI|nr:hypothetical protein M501DRAFT_1060383 [Patellaria atrata CBS 101060]
MIIPTIPTISPYPYHSILPKRPNIPPLRPTPNVPPSQHPPPPPPPKPGSNNPLIAKSLRLSLSLSLPRQGEDRRQCIA